MTAMLASVRTVEEALLALEGGADIIDLKDPARGALGALDPDTARSIVGAIAGRVPSSATIGDLPSMMPAEMLAAAERTAVTGVNFVKAGFFSAPTQVACAHALTPLARRIPLVAVLFADLEPDFTLIARLAECSFAGVMLDTARKNSGPLLRHLDLAALADFVRRSRAVGLFTGLAGSLREADVGTLLALDPDYLGFRGALCAEAERTSTLDANAFNRIREAIPRAALPPARGRALGVAA
jgi:dihydroneopterin aldolase